MTNKEKLLIRIKKMDKIESIVKHAMTVGAVVLSVNIIADKVEQIANTLITLTVVIIVLILYGVKQNKFIGDKTKQMTKHNQELEKKIDPTRTSSELTERGETNPMDK